MEQNERTKIITISLLVSCAAALQLAESLIPHPIPGVRFGLANMITLVTLVVLGLKASLQVAALRVLLSSFIIGNFMSPSFLLSFSGAVSSTLVMGLFYRLSTSNRKHYLSIIGISIAGAVTHNYVQLALVYCLIVKHKGILLMLPWLGISGIVFGYFTGIIAAAVCRKLQKTPPAAGIVNTSVYQTDSDTVLESSCYEPIDSPVHRISPELKFGILLILFIVILLTGDILSYVLISFFLLIVLFLSRVSFFKLFNHMSKYSAVILFCFFLPLLFTEGRIIYELGYLKVTREGLNKGILLTVRMIFFIFSANLLVLTTSNKKLVNGLKNILSPLKLLGISVDKLSEIINISWQSLPIFTQEITGVFKDARKKKKVSRIIPLLSHLVYKLFRRAESHGDTNSVEHKRKT